MEITVQMLVRERWRTHVRAAVPLAAALRLLLMTASARQTARCCFTSGAAVLRCFLSAYTADSEREYLAAALGRGLIVLPGLRGVVSHHNLSVATML